MKLFSTSIFLLIFGFLFYGNNEEKQFVSIQDCEVDLEAISGSYEGDCRRGKAHGEGKAQGTDTYTGEFRKGMPHGEGTYVWANGNTFVGEFDDGVKEGEGKLTIKRDSKADSVVTGFWEDDKYLGQYKDPYQVTSRSSEIQRIIFRRMGDNPNQIGVNFNREIQGGRLILDKAPNQQTGNGWINIDFPFDANVEAAVKTTQGTGTGYRNVSFEFEIYQPGNWDIQVSINPDI